MRRFSPTTSRSSSLSPSSRLASPLLRGRRLTFWHAYLFASPIMLPFYPLVYYVNGRKEILLFAVFAAWLLFLRRPGPPDQRVHLAFALVMAAMTLVHEVFFFYALFFVIAAFLRYRDPMEGLKASALLPVAAFAAMCAIFLFGSVLDGEAICNRIMERGAHGRVCTGAILWYPPGHEVNDWNPNSLQSALDNIVRKWDGELLLAGLPLLAVCLFLPAYRLLAGADAAMEPRKQWLFRALVCLALLVTVPLFFTGKDWGRWFHIPGMLIALSFLITAPLQEPLAKKGVREGDPQGTAQGGDARGGIRKGTLAGALRRLRPSPSAFESPFAPAVAQVDDRDHLRPLRPLPRHDLVAEALLHGRDHRLAHRVALFVQAH